MPKFQTIEDVANSIGGDLLPALAYGTTAADMPEGHPQLAEAWNALDAAWAGLKSASTAVEDLLPNDPS